MYLAIFVDEETTRVSQILPQALSKCENIPNRSSWETRTFLTILAETRRKKQISVVKRFCNY